MEKLTVYGELCVDEYRTEWCYKATLDAYNEYLRSYGKPEVDKLDFKHEVNLPYRFQDMF